MMRDPCSSHSFRLIHSCWKEPRLARMEPPIQTANRRSMDPGVTVRTLTDEVMHCVMSKVRRCARLGRSDPPPTSRMLDSSSLRRSGSHAITASRSMEVRPVAPDTWRGAGSKSSSGTENLCAPRSTRLPSGSSYTASASGALAPEEWQATAQTVCFMSSTTRILANLAYEGCVPANSVYLTEKVPSSATLRCTSYCGRMGTPELSSEKSSCAVNASPPTGDRKDGFSNMKPSATGTTLVD
mmetsp:Transcript_15348/g.48988  ORF Transcript_15348/g.48988 Transcript_15348/m.48988 type:complete len:241 (-) Transcript_15348:498-1220(-)